MTEEQQQLQLDKLIASQTRARIALEKTHTKTLKKMAKCGENTDQKQQTFKGELQAMLQTQDQQVWGQGHEESGHGQSMGRFNEAGLHESVPFVIFCARGRERLQHHFRADF